MTHGRNPGMTRVTRIIRTLAPLALAFAAIGGCASTPDHYDDPIAVMMDKSEGHSDRWAAARQAEKEMWNDPKRIKALKDLVWVRGYPPQFSNYAVDQLVAVDEQAAKAELSNSIILVQDWTTIQHILDTAVERNWVDFVPAIVRQYAQTTPVYTDLNRPERAAIQKLRPNEPVEQVILEVFVDDEKMEVRQRAAAWQLMMRLATDHQALIDKLNTMNSDDPLVGDLQAGARDLNLLPDNMETVTWLRMLRMDPTFWAKAKAVVATLGPEPKRDMQLRHLGVLIYLSEQEPSVLSRSRAELQADAVAFNTAQRHYLKGPNFDGPMQDYPQRLSDWQDTLSWGDLAVLAAVRRWMADRGVVEQWFKQATADEQDESTEYGGLIVPNSEGRAYPKLYKPMTRMHDLKYVPPKELILDAYTALAHYHFHAQDFKNQRYAGPGYGDVQFAKRHQLNNLVLTFIDEATLNVDYYQSPDVVIDMGAVSR